MKKQVKIEYKDGYGARYHHRIPDSLRAFCRIVSFTVTKTSLMFDVSVAWVILQFMLVNLNGRRVNDLLYELGIDI